MVGITAVDTSGLLAPTLSDCTDRQDHGSLLIPWSRDVLRSFEEFISEPFPTSASSSISPFLTSYDRQSSFDRTLYPQYKITEDADAFRIYVDVPGVQASDISAQIEDGGKTLRLRGSRRMIHGNSLTESMFEKSFIFDGTVDPRTINANLTDGVLVVTATKDLGPP